MWDCLGTPQIAAALGGPQQISADLHRAQQISADLKPSALYLPSGPQPGVSPIALLSPTDPVGPADEWDREWDWEWDRGWDVSGTGTCKLGALSQTRR